MARPEKFLKDWKYLNLLALVFFLSLLLVSGWVLIMLYKIAGLAVNVLHINMSSYFSNV